MSGTPDPLPIPIAMAHARLNALKSRLETHVAAPKAAAEWPPIVLDVIGEIQGVLNILVAGGIPDVAVGGVGGTA